MEHKYSDIFINAWVSVLGSFCNKQIVSANVKPPKQYPDGRDLFVFMGLAGDLNGQVFMSMDEETGKTLTSEMLGGIEVSEVDEMVTSTVGELCNMIMGTACTQISAADMNLDITPPMVISNSALPKLDHKISYSIAIIMENLKAIDFNVAVV